MRLVIVKGLLWLVGKLTKGNEHRLVVDNELPYEIIMHSDSLHFNYRTNTFEALYDAEFKITGFLKRGNRITLSQKQQQ